MDSPITNNQSPVTNPRPMNEPHTPISSSEMNSNMHNESASNGRNTLLTLASLLILSGIVGITLYLYIQNKTSKQSPQVEKTPQITTPQPTQTQEKTELISGIPVVGDKNIELVKKYGVVCRRFTSLDEALKTPEIACMLDLSDQNLSEIPENILKLTHLNELNLSDNKFTEFPEILFQSKTLLSVNLENNNLATMPDDIKSKIPTLQSVKLKGNNLSEEVIEKHQRLISSPLPTQP